MPAMNALRAASEYSGGSSGGADAAAAGDDAATADDAAAGDDAVDGDCARAPGGNAEARAVASVKPARIVKRIDMAEGRSGR